MRGVRAMIMFTIVPLLVTLASWVKLAAAEENAKPVASVNRLQRERIASELEHIAGMSDKGVWI